MIRKTKKIYLLHLIIVLMITGCLGQKGETTADCSLGQDFDALSRTCQGAQRAPVGLLDDAVIYEDSGLNEIFITYSDDNGSEAVSCQINYVRTNVWLRSGQWDNSGVEAFNAIQNGNLAAAAIDAGTFALQSGDALAAMVSADAASQEIPSSKTNPQRSSALRQAASYIRIAGQLAAGISGAAFTQTSGLIAIASADTLDLFADSIDAACSCSGGVCKMVAIPDRDWFGEVAFSYTVNDGIENSPVEPATLRVLAINDAPIAVSQDVTFMESTTSAPSPQSFIVNLARDVEDDLFSNFFEYSVVIDDPLKGTLSDCMDKIGSTGPTDRTCTYTPITGDVNAPLGLNAFIFNLSGIDWTAKAAGIHGDDISVILVENPITRSGGLNGIGGVASVVINVVGTDITVTIESDIEVVGPNTYNAHTIQNVIDAINLDNYASSLLTAVLNGGATAGDPAAISPQTSLGGGVDGYEVISYRVNDGANNTIIDGVVNINILETDDDPVAFTPAQLIVEDVIQTITLSYSDAENNLATACTISAISNNIQLRSACLCTATGICTVDVVGLIDHNILLAPGSFQYTINNGQVSNLAQVDFTITPVDDLPLPVYQNVDFLESSTALALDYVLNITPAYDVDSIGVVIPTYEILTSPGQGVISSCLDLPGSLGATDLECIYTPVDGNINDNDLNVPGAVTINGITYTAIFDGTSTTSKNITIEIIETIGVTSTEPLFYFVQSGTPPAATTLNIRILVSPIATPTSAATLAAAWNAHPYAGQIITAAVLGGNQATAIAQPLVGGVGGMDFFDYKVTYAPGVSVIGRVNINMTPVNDTPVICQYSDFNEAPECGILGCTGAISPIGDLVIPGIIPNKADLYYFDTSRALCFKSNGAIPFNNTNWEIVSSYVADQYINEKDTIITEDIKVDEGGGDTTEDQQLLRIIAGSLTSSNLALVPLSQIQIYYPDENSPLGIGDNFGSVVASEDLGNFRIVTTPAELVAGTTTITFQLDDVSGGTVSNPGLPQDGTLGGTPLLVSFDIIVNPVSALHNGWENIRALGAKVNSLGAVLDMTEVCTYNRANCDGGASCSGTSDPLNAVIPDKTFTIFYNSTTKGCFYADGVTAADWKPLKGLVLPDEVYCNITPVEFEPACDQLLNFGSCIGNGAPLAALVPTKENHFYWDKNNNTCYRSRDLDIPPNGLDNGDWEEYKSTGSAFMEWKPFTISGAGALTGYNVFRRLTNEVYDYKRPINRTPINVSVFKYTDNAENSWIAPIPKTVYFYEVRPIINGIDTSTSEVYKDVRVMIPPENMSFAHRWIMNQSMCNTMNSTGIDASNHFRCPYVGPGNDTATLTIGDLTFASKKKLDPSMNVIINDVGANTCTFNNVGGGPDTIVIGIDAATSLASDIVAAIQASVGCAAEIEAYVSGQNRLQPAIAVAQLFLSAPYYDIGQDLLVERFEASCNFTRSPSCDTPYGGCVADGSPVGVITSSLLSDIYYDRGTGDCYKSTGAFTTNWDLITETTSPFAHETPENPPLVNLTQSQANNICTLAGNAVNEFLGYSNEALEMIRRKLPTKIQQAAYSQWDSKVNTDNNISILETGLSINSSAKCNSSNASGLAGNYSDTDVPDTNTMYSLPGTASSNIRSIITGSTQTDLCVSRFDIQDVVGNVKEWVNARIDCDGGPGALGLSTCLSVAGADTLNHQTINSDSATVYTDFKMDGVVGPCRDTNSDGICDSFLDKWLIDQERYNAGRWFVPIGLPVYSNFPFDNSVDDANAFMYEIGPTSGITAAQLHDDAMAINSHYLFASSNGVGAMATGGSYLNGQEAGVYSFEYLPSLNDSYAYLTIGDISFKSLFALDPNLTIEINQQAGPITCAIVNNVSPVADTVVITIEAGVTDTANGIIAAVNTACVASVPVGAGIEARLSGIDQAQSLTLGAIDIIPSPATSTRNDVGFRCVLPIVNGDYEE
jgi:trimeric autotransporter adhesin